MGVLNGTWAGESPMSTRSKTLLITLDIDAAGAKLSGPTDPLAPSELSSERTSPPQPWEPPYESCSIPTEAMGILTNEHGLLAQQDQNNQLVRETSRGQFFHNTCSNQVS